MNLNKYNITETPLVKFESKDFDKSTNFIEIEIPRFLDVQLRKYRMDNDVNYFYLNVKSPNGTIKTFMNPTTNAAGIDYTCDGLTLRLIIKI